MNVGKLFLSATLAGGMMGCTEMTVQDEQDEEVELQEQLYSLDDDDDDDDDHNSALWRLRGVTAKYFRQERATQDGFALGIDGKVTHCVEHPTDGAMGFHWGNQARFDDPAIDLYKPEVLVYAPTANGGQRLAAVEWVVYKPAWEAAGNVNPPVLLGHEFEILNPALNWYVFHAWIWRYNPAGLFEHWNPLVDCP